MKFRKLVLLLVFNIFVVASTGCTTISLSDSFTIYSQSIQEFIDNPSESDLSIREGENIDIYLKDTISIASVAVSIINMDVINVDTTGIKGKVVIVCCVDDNEQDIVQGNIVEVKLAKIDEIRVNITRQKIELKRDLFVGRGDPVYLVLIILWLLLSI